MYPCLENWPIYSDSLITLLLKGGSLMMIQNTSKHALLSSHQRPPNGGIF